MGDEAVGDIGENVRYMRGLRGLTRGELEVKSGVSSGQITKLEQGVSTNPTIDTLRKLAAALDISIEHLWGSRPLPKPPAEAKTRSRFTPGTKRKAIRARRVGGNRPFTEPAIYQHVYGRAAA